MDQGLGLTLKYPQIQIFDQVDVSEKPQQQQLRSLARNTGTIEYSTDISKGLGISTAVILFISILYMYGTSKYQNKIRFNIKNGSPTYTFSEAVENTEKIGATVIIITFLALLQSLFTAQNFNTKDFKRLSLVVVNYLVVLGLLLLFFVVPKKRLGHGLVSLILIINIVYTAGLVDSLYHQYYTDESLKNLDLVSYAIYIIFAILLTVFFTFAITNYFNMNWLYVPVHHLIGSFELMLLFAYGVFIVYFGFLPPIRSDDELVCAFK
jgi:hypothetical protein